MPATAVKLTSIVEDYLSDLRHVRASGGGNLRGDDFALTAGWGHFGSGQAVMPGQGRAVERRVHRPRARRPRRRRPDPRRHHIRHLPKPPRLLAQHPLRRLDLQARRLPGPKKVALLPRAQSPSPPPPPPRSQHPTNTTRRITAILLLVASE